VAQSQVVPPVKRTGGGVPIHLRDHSSHIFPSRKNLTVASPVFGSWFGCFLSGCFFVSQARWPEASAPGARRSNSFSPAPPYFPRMPGVGHYVPFQLARTAICPHVAEDLCASHQPFDPTASAFVRSESFHKSVGQISNLPRPQAPTNVLVIVKKVYVRSGRAATVRPFLPDWS